MNDSSFHFECNSHQIYQGSIISLIHVYLVYNLSVKNLRKLATSFIYVLAPIFISLFNINYNKIKIKS